MQRPLEGLRLRLGCRRPGLRRAFHEQVDIGSAEAEGTDAGDLPTLDPRPGHALRGHAYGETIPGDDADWGCRKCRCGGISSCSRDRTTLIRSGDARGRLRGGPRLVFTEPMISGVIRGAALAQDRPEAPISIGSPSDVPVPCASM